MRMGLGFEMEGKEKGKGIRKGKGNGKHCAQYSYSMYEYVSLVCTALLM
jgi:hypothetical protein